jgi:hypothetical protein
MKEQDVRTMKPSAQNASNNYYTNPCGSGSESPVVAAAVAGKQYITCKGNGKGCNAVFYHGFHGLKAISRIKWA